MDLKTCVIVLVLALNLAACVKPQHSVQADANGNPPGCSEVEPATPFRSFDAHPVPIQMVPAKYPALARAAEVEGEVILLVTIGRLGYVCDAEVMESSLVHVDESILDWDAAAEQLENACIEAALKWRYEPATSEGVAVRVSISVPFRFSLSG